MEPGPTTNAAQRARWPLLVAALLAAQALAVVVYFVVERERAPELRRDLGFEPLSLALPTLTLERPGETLTLPSGNDDELTLLHVWATWCKPCREELPTLLALDDEVPLVFASTDESWPVIEHYFDGEVPSAVWRLHEEGGLPLRALPTTFVLQDGRVLARVEGAWRWTNAGVERLLSEVGD